MEKLLVHRSPLELNNGHPAIFIAIGSLGNELGMGNVAPQVEEHIPLGDLLCTPVCSLVERFDRRGTEPFELFRSEFGQHCARIQESGNFARIHQKSKNFRNYYVQHSLQYLAKFREIFIKI